MVNGAVIASGAPGEIRSNADVQTAYLGAVDIPEGAAQPA
jgi:ABC-type branched-subunit amino acid transport system ATPase component